MAARVSVSALVSVLLGSGLLAVCAGRSAAETHETATLAGEWKATTDFDSNGKLRVCMAVRAPNKDGVAFGVFAAPNKAAFGAFAASNDRSQASRPLDNLAWGAVLVRASWQLEPNDDVFVDVIFDGQAQYHLPAKALKNTSLLIYGNPHQSEELARLFRKSYVLSISFQGERFEFNLAGTYRLFPVLTNCVQTAGFKH